MLETTTGQRQGIGWGVNLFLVGIIALNAIAIVLHTVPELSQTYDYQFAALELFSSLFFTVEYGLRLWVCVEDTRYRHPVWGRLRYVCSASSIIDILAIFPFYFTLFATDLAIVRIFRLFRILRLFRISRYSHAFRVIRHAVDDKKEELILSMVFVLFMLVIVASVMYYVEHLAQPTAFSSIPATMWWAVNAMTTVGYGDIRPITPLGKFLGGLAAIIGILLFALPTGILTSGFLERLRTVRNEEQPRCPHCGKEL